VIEQIYAPVFGRMAGLALTAEFAAMFVVTAVTGDAGCRRILVICVLVTGAALHIQMFADERIFGFAMIETHLLPVIRDVTRATVLAQ